MIVEPYSKQQRLEMMWHADPGVRDMLRGVSGLEEARWRFMDYLDRRQLVRDSSSSGAALRVLRNSISERCEQQSGERSLSHLVRMAAKPTESDLASVSEGFMEEFRHLFAAVAGDAQPNAHMTGASLEDIGMAVGAGLRRYADGFDAHLHAEREDARRRVLDDLAASPEQWDDWRWHVDSAIRDREALSRIIDLDAEEHAVLDWAARTRVPFAVTPYYASLMERSSEARRTRSLRIQVIPSRCNVEELLLHRSRGLQGMDYMGEQEMSPAASVVRRYPSVAVIKPHHGCAQLCTYCQRNWQVSGDVGPRSCVSDEEIEGMMDWLGRHDEIIEVLVTGGDALIMPDDRIRHILDSLVRLPHVERIRLCTRMPVVLPQRITVELADLIASYIDPARRDVCVVTHFQHVSEMTPEAARAVQMLTRRGVAVYNQSVFTIQNARRFELAALRRIMSLVGVIPYYTFAAKDKPESRDIRVPIARLLQERHEESRMLPGIARTDALVFNIPRRGKVELSSNRHEVIMITPRGTRVYALEPWNESGAAAERFIYEDVSIRDFLTRMSSMGEDPEDYESIWYYY